MSIPIRVRSVRLAKRVLPPRAAEAAGKLLPAGVRLQASRRMVEYDFRRLVNSQLEVAERESGIGQSMGYPSWGLLYYALICTLPPAGRVTVVETGTNLGLSTIVLAQALSDSGREGTVHTVDIDPERVAVAKGNLASAKLTSLVEFSVGPSLAFLKEICRSPVNFAFLDAGHDYRSVMEEFECVRPAVASAKGSVYFDNTTAGGVAKAIRRVRKRYAGDVIEFPGCSWSPPGNAIWQARAPRRPWAS